MVIPKQRVLWYFVSYLLIYAPVYAKLASDPPNNTDSQTLPRFASLKSQKVNMRVGPGMQYPVSWLFISKNEPVEILQEFGHWREIRDIDNVKGWVHVSILGPVRYVIVTKIHSDMVLLYKAPNLQSQAIAKIFPEVSCQLKKIKGDWCQVNCNNVQGWIEKQYLWGLHKHE